MAQNLYFCLGFNATTSKCHNDHDTRAGHTNVNKIASAPMRRQKTKMADSQ